MVDFDLPAAVVQEQVVAFAGQGEVVDVRFSAVCSPKCHVVGRGPFGAASAAGPGEAFVSDGQCAALFGGGGALGAAQVQALAFAVEYCGVDL